MLICTRTNITAQFGLFEERHSTKQQFSSIFAFGTNKKQTHWIWLRNKNKTAECEKSRSVTKRASPTSICLFGCEKCNETLHWWKSHPLWECTTNHLLPSQSIREVKHTLTQSDIQAIESDEKEREKKKVSSVREKFISPKCICCFDSHMPMWHHFHDTFE